MDFNKTLDSFYHRKIWETLAIQGVQKDIIKILEEIYKNNTAQICLDTVGEPERGGKIGRPLLPKYL